MSYTVIGGAVSPFVRKVRVALAEKGLAYELEQVNPFAPPEGFREISPLGRIPAFRDGDATLADSSVICAYLERRHPEPPLYPKDDLAYAHALWIEEYMDGGMVPVAGPKIFRPLVLAPLMTGQEPDEAAEQTAQAVVDETLPEYWDYLEGQLGEAEFFVDDRLTIADISVASPHVNLRHAGVAPARARWPRLRGFLDRMHARPSFAALIEEETPIFGKRAARIED
ncbi:MAG: glutathione S-transferase family protein [Myxococcota bacterium]|nr:glutathione S-transferase family protein [Myxococcota bacterium]